MRRTGIQIAATTVWALVAATICAADVVELSDGSRLLGKVERMQDGKLLLTTEFAGTIGIDATKVVRVETDEPMAMNLDSGDRLIGRIYYSDDADVTVVETEFGGLAVPVQRVTAIWPKDEKSPEIVMLEEQNAKAREEMEAAIEAARGKWSLAFEFGAVFQEGNTDKFNVNARLEAIRKSADDLLKLYALGKFGETNDIRDEAEVKVGARYEYNFSDRFFAFVRNEYEYDEFEELDLRVTVTGGPGYYFIKNPGHELKGFFGAGYEHESFFDGTQNDQAILEIGADYLLEITPWARLTHEGRYYPTFDGIDDYRLSFDTAVVFPIGESDAWKFKIGALYEYDSMPRPGIERLDQTYYANILLEVD